MGAPRGIPACPPRGTGCASPSFKGRRPLKAWACTVVQQKSRHASDGTRAVACGPCHRARAHRGGANTRPRAQKRTSSQYGCSEAWARARGRAAAWACCSPIPLPACSRRAACSPRACRASCGTRTCRRASHAALWERGRSEAGAQDAQPPKRTARGDLRAGRTTHSPAPRGGAPGRGASGTGPRCSCPRRPRPSHRPSAVARA